MDSVFVFESGCGGSCNVKCAGHAAVGSPTVGAGYSNGRAVEGDRAIVSFDAGADIAECAEHAGGWIETPGGGNAGVGLKDGEGGSIDGKGVGITWRSRAAGTACKIEDDVEWRGHRWKRGECWCG